MGRSRSRTGGHILAPPAPHLTLADRLAARPCRPDARLTTALPLSRAALIAAAGLSTGWLLDLKLGEGSWEGWQDEAKILARHFAFGLDVGVYRECE